MSKKHKHHGRSTITLSDQRARVERAMHEERYQQALELAKQLYKDDPSPAHKELLQKVYLGRAKQLRDRGYSRDARSILEHALTLDPKNPTWMATIAQELAASGEAREALHLAEKLTGSPLQGKVLAQAIDNALLQGANGRHLVPEDLRGQFDLIVHAFAQLAAGEDEAARQSLQGIGLQSPLLEWKLLVRGLQAYYLNEDERALENWQRLNPERLPARLAAPLRFRIDPAYRVSQSPKAQTLLQKQADQLQSSPLTAPLRRIQQALSKGELPQAFREAENVLPTMRREAPQLVPRLASCFYWAIVQGGEPRDIQRYRHAFGVPPDDPEFARLQALVMESMADFQKAHDYWKQFAQSVAHNPTAWPGDQGQRVRALVWWHMGQNAAKVPDPDKILNLPPFLRDHPARPKPLKPTAEECFRESLKLAPDQLETYEALFHYYQQEKKQAKAIEAAKKLLEHFPDHLPTLTELAALYMEEQEYGEALNYYQRALKANPLDRRLRAKVSTAHLFHARTCAENGQFDEARGEYQASIAYSDGQDHSSALCKWAACEFKAGDTARAEELLQQALTRAGSHLAVAFNMVIEIIRLKLPRSLKTRFDKDFNAALAEPPTAVGAVAIAQTSAAHRSAGITYYGQKTHEKKVLTYLDKSLRIDWPEEQLESICASLLELKGLKQLRQFTALGRRKFPTNPFFPFMEAESYIAAGPNRSSPYRIQPWLEKARQLVQALPREHRHKGLQELIEQRQQLLGMAHPFFGRGMMNMFENLFGFGPDEFDDYQDGF